MNSIQYILVLVFINSIVIAQSANILEIKSKQNSVCNDQTWNLVWQDEFDGNQLDVSKWFSYYPYTNTGMDTCLQCRSLGGDLFISDSNLVFEDGVLKIMAKKQKASWFGKEFEHTSGNLFSKQGFLYGRFEIRCKLPKGLGLWPAFWTLGEGVIEEIDVFEIKGNRMRRFQSNYHHCYDKDKKCQDLEWHSSPDLSSKFNVFAIEWDPYFIKWFINDKLVRTLGGYQSIKSEKRIKNCTLKPGNYVLIENYPKHKARIIAGLGIEGTGRKKKLKDSLFPAALEIDYIRVYQRPAIE